MAVTPYKTALITGASRGIGAALCRRLAELDLTVYALARSVQGLTVLAADSRIKPIVADVRNTDEILSALEGVELDLLINNAGFVASVRPLYEQTAEEVSETVAVNLTAPLQLMRAFLPGMVARRRGHVVNITSAVAHHVFAGMSAYGGAKAGLSMAGRALRYDIAASNVRVTEVAPGRVETDIYLQAFAGDRTRLQETLYGDVRSVKPEDVAAAVIALLLLPEHVDITQIEVMPTDQATGGHVYAKRRG